MKRSYEMDLCSGPLLSKILLFSLPLILSGVLQLLFNATDIVVVGKFAGSNAMAAVGSTTSLFNLLVNSFIGISVGANVLVARHYGERDYDGVQQTIQTALLTGLIGGTILIVLGVVLARPMLTLMATPDEVIDQAVLYMQVYFIGMPATMIYNFGAAVLRAVGDTRRPLYFLMAAGVMNVLGDLLFVCVLGMGVAGVALATVLSQCVSAALTVLCLTGSDGMCHLDIRRLRFYPERFAQIMKIGLPASCFGEGLDPEVRRAVLEAAGVLMLLLFFAVSCCLFYTRRYLRPILRDIERLKDESGGTQMTFDELQPVSARLRSHEQTITVLETEKLDLQGQVEHMQSQVVDTQEQLDDSLAEIRRLAYLGKKELDPADYQKFLEGYAKLSSKELEICAALAKGLSARQCAEQTGNALSTIDTYRKRVYEKTNIHRVRQLRLCYALMQLEQAEQDK